MAASGLLRERDLRALTAVIEDGLRDDPGRRCRGRSSTGCSSSSLPTPSSSTSSTCRGELISTSSRSTAEARDSRGAATTEVRDARGLGSSGKLPAVQLLGAHRRRDNVLRWSDFYTVRVEENAVLRRVPGARIAQPIRHLRAVPGGPGGLERSGSSAPTGTSANGIGSPSNCCGRTCTRSTSTPNAAATASRT